MILSAAKYNEAIHNASTGGESKGQEERDGVLEYGGGSCNDDGNEDGARGVEVEEGMNKRSTFFGSSDLVVCTKERL